MKKISVFFVLQFIVPCTLAFSAQTPTEQVYDQNAYSAPAGRSAGELADDFDRANAVIGKKNLDLSGNVVPGETLVAGNSKNSLAVYRKDGTGILYLRDKNTGLLVKEINLSKPYVPLDQLKSVVFTEDGNFFTVFYSTFGAFGVSVDHYLVVNKAGEEIIDFCNMFKLTQVSVNTLANDSVSLTYSESTERFEYPPSTVQSTSVFYFNKAVGKQVARTSNKLLVLNRQDKGYGEFAETLTLYNIANATKQVVYKNDSATNGTWNIRSASIVGDKIAIVSSVASYGPGVNHVDRVAVITTGGRVKFDSFQTLGRLKLNNWSLSPTYILSMEYQPVTIVNYTEFAGPIKTSTFRIV